MAKITYENKEFLNKNENIADKNKVNDTDLNEIKNVVNENDDNIGNLSNLNTINKDSLVGAINELLPVILYETSVSTNTLNITLNDDVKNYSYLDIYVTDHEREVFTRIENPNGKQLSITVPTISGDSNEVQFRIAIFSIQNLAITSVRQRVLSFRTNSVGLWDSNCYIYKVIGYK